MHVSFKHSNKEAHSMVSNFLIKCFILQWMVWRAFLFWYISAAFNRLLVSTPFKQHVIIQRYLVACIDYWVVSIATERKGTIFIFYTIENFCYYVYLKLWIDITEIEWLFLSIMTVCSQPQFHRLYCQNNRLHRFRTLG